MINRSARLPGLVALLVAAPAFAGEGPQIGLQVGYGFWNTRALHDKLQGTDAVGKQLADQLTDPLNMGDGGTYILQLGYNIMGHVAVEAQVTVHPWYLLDTFTDSTGSHAKRGLFGVGSGIVTWYPLQSLMRPDRTYDFSLYGGIGYGLFGGGKPFELGMDGMVSEFGGTAEIYVRPWLSIGITPRLYLLQMQRFIVNFNTRDSGGAIYVPNASGGWFFATTASFILHLSPVQQPM